MYKSGRWVWCLLKISVKLEGCWRRRQFLLFPSAQFASHLDSDRASCSSGRCWQALFDPAAHLEGCWCRLSVVHKASCSADTTDLRYPRIRLETGSLPSRAWGQLTCRWGGLSWTQWWRQVGWPERSLWDSPGLRANLQRQCPLFAHLVVVSSSLPAHDLTGVFVINNKQDFWRQAPASSLLVSAEHGRSERAVSAARTARAVPGASPFQRVSQAFKTPASFRSCAGHGLIGTNGKRT